MKSDRVALVTGGAKRVGGAIARQLSDAGFAVAITYLSSRTEAEQLTAQWIKQGRRGLAIQADLTDPDKFVPQLAKKVLDEFGRLDVLVNSASIYKPSTLANTDQAIIQKMMAIHFRSPLLLCRAFEQILRDNHGHVVNMIDLLAERPWQNMLAYCASKAALANLTLALAKELAPEVTVNGIAPGVVAWPPDYPQIQREQYLQRVPLARPGTPEDVAGLVLYLATAAPYVTGQILRLDGGRSVT